MDEHSYLKQVLMLLAVAILNVVLSRRLKLSPVLGYLVLGALIGEHGLKYVDQSDYIHALSEFGVVFLLFAIGLELTFERLIQMRFHVFGFGGLQLLISTVCLAYGLQFLFKLQTSISILVGCALSLSSTAIVMQVLAETKRQSTQVGRLSLSVLLMQDFAVVPLLAILPLLKSNSDTILNEIGYSALKALLVIVLITIAGRLLLRPFFGLIGSAKSEEVYVSTTLLIVLGAAYLTSSLGLSTAMGAFVAGILIAETEYHTRVENSILPFKSLLLGLFFLSVGMSIDVSYVISAFDKVIFLALGLIVIKGLTVFFLCMVFKFRLGAAIHSGMLLSQGSEFAFILFNLATGQKVLDPSVSQLLLVLVSVTMAITPLLSALGRYIEDKIDHKEEFDKYNEFKGVSDLHDHIIIAGFGRVGRVVAHMLAEQKFNYIAVDSDLAKVKKARKQGFPVYHGDLSSTDVLRAVGASRAACVILTMDDKLALRKSVKAVSIHYKNLDIISRAEDFRHGQGLRKLGASYTVPATIETGLQMGGALLQSLGVADHDILALKEQFRRNNYSLTEEIELFRGVPPTKQTLGD